MGWLWTCLSLQLNIGAAWRSSRVTWYLKGTAEGWRPQLRKNTPWVSWLNIELELKPGLVLFWGLSAAGRPNLEGSSV